MSLLSKLVKYGNVDMDQNSYQYHSMEVPDDQRDEALLGEDAQLLRYRDSDEVSYNDRIREDARQIIENAQIIANKIRTYAIKSAREEYLNARNKGYETGYAECLADAGRKNSEVLAELKEILHTVSAEKEALLTNYEIHIRDLSLAIAKKVIGEVVQQDDRIFLNLYKKAVEDFTGKQWIKVIVSDQDATFATENSKLLLSMVKGCKHIQIEPLKGAPKGTCVVESPAGTADSGVETQLAKIESALLSQAEE